MWPRADRLYGGKWQFSRGDDREKIGWRNNKVAGEGGVEQGIGEFGIWCPRTGSKKHEKNQAPRERSPIDLEGGRQGDTIDEDGTREKRSESVR